MTYLIIFYSLISFLLLFFFAKIGYRINLVDLPNKRKAHSIATAYTGGIAISIALVFSILILDISNNDLNTILSIAFLISIVGLIDDRFNLNVGGKLSLQIIPVFYLIVFQNLSLHHLGNYDYFKIELGAFALPFTLFCVLFLINAINYFDGMDGTLGFLTISIIIILYFLVPDLNFKKYLSIILIPISIFLFFNFSFFKFPKLFLGDSGSLLLGFILSFILIYLSDRNNIHPILLAWSISILVYEFLSINFIRLKNEKNLFKAGRDHLHHILFKKFKSLFLTNFIIIIINIFLFLLGYWSFLLISPLASLALFVSLFFVFLFFRSKYSKK
jgi:UDP-GlcNAc:undecaprenyl-phosphate GlcNAc-1-phosphate transferase